MKLNRTIILLMLAQFVGMTILMMLLCGCTSTQIEYGDFKVKRFSCMQNVYVRAGVDTNNNPYVIYSNDGGAEVARETSTAAITAAGVMAR